MRSNNRAVPAHRTYEGAAAVVKTKDQLERLVACTMLFENTFYEKGDEQAANIAEACRAETPEKIAEIAIKAREVFKLRHVPLFLIAQLSKRAKDCKEPGLIKSTVVRVLKRPDECGELLKIMANDRKTTVKKAMTHAVQKGIAQAMLGFNEYQLAKWNRDSEVKLKDVIFLTHPNPKGGSFSVVEGRNGKVNRHNSGQANVFSRIIDGTLESPDTWEVALSAGNDKKETWERLIEGKKLGYMALLKNLRNMTEAKVKRTLVEKAILSGAENSKALPFRFLSAERHAPDFSGVLSDALLSSIKDQKGSLPGNTAIMVDVSGSMFGTRISSKSELDRFEAAAAMAILAKEICESSSVYAFANDAKRVKNTRGIPLVEEIRRTNNGGTRIGNSVKTVLREENPDRLIIITDEESQDNIENPKCETWILNVASYKPVLQVAGNVRRILGFSERVLDFIKYEQGIEIAESE